jgi:hypothetical protein
VRRLFGNISQACTYDRLLATLVFAPIVLASALTPIQTDTWWQLRAGQDMWLSHRVVLVDTYSHTAYGAAWPNHEWLAEVIYYGVYRLGGLPLVTLFATALITGAWILVWNLMKGPVRVRFFMTALALVPASTHWEPRPHAFSLLFQMIEVFLIIRRRHGWLPVLFLVWANCHGGVLTGFVLLVVALGVTTLEEPRMWWQGVLTFIGCLAAATVTPLGLSFWTEIPRSLARIHQYPLDEWRPPSLTDLRMLPFWAIAVALCVALARYRRGLRARIGSEGIVVCVCALALLPFATSAIRSVGPFLMLALPGLTALLAGEVVTETRQPEVRPTLNATLMSCAVTAVAVVIVVVYRLQLDHLRWTPLPAASLDALKRCPGNLYNRYDEGGYLIWFAPQRRVFLDGRQDPYDPSLVLEQIRVETAGDYRATFTKYDIGCAYLPARSPVAARLSQDSWTTLYRDSRWVVLASPPSSRFDDKRTLTAQP